MAKHRNKFDDDTDDEDEGREYRPKKRPRRSWRMWFVSRLIVVLILMAGLACGAPLLLGKAGLWKSAVSFAAPQLAGKIDAAAVELWWFSPIEIRGLVVRDPAGQSMVEAPLIRSRKTLLEIALNYCDLGTFEIQDAKGRIVLREGGSNVEDFLATLPKSEGGSSSVGFGVALSRGAVEVEDQIARRNWQLDGITLEVTCPSATDQPKSGKLAAVLTSAGNVANKSGAAGSGQIAGEFAWQSTNDSATSIGAGQGQLTLVNVPTEFAEGPLRRYVADIRPQGSLSLKTSATWAEDGKSLRIAVAQLTVPQFSIAAPAYLGADRPTLAITSGKADVQILDGHIKVAGAEFNSNLVQITAQGSAPLAALSPASVQDIQLNGQLDLAELSRQLPNTVRLRSGTEITSGKIQVSLADRSTPGGRGWEADVRTAEIVATAGGRPIRFEQPLAVNLLVRQTDNGPTIERLVGRSSFLELEGRGTLAEGTITAQANLDRLVSELGRLIDWGDRRIAGTLDGKLQWTSGQGGRASATADAVVRNFEFSASGMSPWREPNLHLAGEARGLVQNQTFAQIDSSKLIVESAADRLEVELVEPVKLPSAASSWPVKFALHGDLATWAPRVQPFVPLGGWRLAGAIDAAGEGRLSRQAGELTKTLVQVNQLSVEGPGLSIREPVVKLEAAGAWDQPHSTLTLSSTVFQSSAIAFRADGLRVVASKEPSLVGMIDFRGDLAKLSSWFASDGQPRGSQLAGALTGRLEIGYRGQSLAGSWTADAENFAYLAPAASNARRGASLASASTAPRWDTLWEEPRVNFAGQGTYDPATGTLKVDRTSIAAGSGSLAAAGTIQKLTAAPAVDLSGEFAYDLDLVTRQLQSLAQRRGASANGALPYGLNTLQLTGKERRTFALKGSLLAPFASVTPVSTAGPMKQTISESLAGEVSLGWRGAQYVGLVAGPADFRANLAKGGVQIGPLDIPISDGRLTTAPRVLLNHPQPAVFIDRGPLIQNVRISPEMCHLWLKYIAPQVADAAQAEGKFSVSLEGAALPISDPVSGSVAGTLSIHSAQVGPGSLAQQYLFLARQIRTLADPGGGIAAAADIDRAWLVLPQQNVTFEVREGAVHHRGLQMTIKDVVITTEGSVGIANQEINLVANVPLQESWFKNQTGLMASMKGRTLQVPIRGTFNKLQVDGRLIEDLSRQFAASAVQGVLEKQLERGQGTLQRELGRGLDKIFGPLQQQPFPPANPQPR